MSSDHHDLVVIGCSAGGVQALPRILRQLPSDLDAAVFIVQHLAATGAPHLARTLQRSAQLPVAWAEQGARIERRRITIAPADVHMTVGDDHVQLSRGPRENHARPSIDKLFRSAAAAHGSRVIAVLLTGMLDDGVAGLRAVRAAGGSVIVQDPLDAAFPELPTRALQVLELDRTLPIDAIGAAIVDRVGQRVEVAQAEALEVELERQDAVSPEAMASLAAQSCYLGRVATARELLVASSLEIEPALWSAVRALDDRVTTLETLAADAANVGNGHSAEAFASRARETRHQLEILRQFMTDLGRPSEGARPSPGDRRAP